MSNTVNLTPKTTKKHNYTPEEIVMLNMAYDSARREAIEQDLDPEAAFAHREAVITKFAAQFDTSTASIRGKLVAEGVYQPRTYIPKRAYKASKEKMVTRLEDILSATPGTFDSLEKVNKQCIEQIVHYMKLLQCGVIEADMSEYYEGL